MNHKRHQSGFTIIEILTVIITLALLASIVTFVYVNQQRESRDDKRRNDIAALAHELDRYYEDTGNYPLSCSHTTPASSTCSAMATNYTIAYGSPVPPQIGGSSMSRDQIRSILKGIGNSFGDPRDTTDNPINQHVTPSVDQIRRTSYLFVSPDALNTSFSVYLALNSSGSSSLTCNVTPTTNDYRGANQGNRPHSYVLGYYSEAESKWVFVSGPKFDSVNNLGWNSSNNPACNLSSL